MLLKQPFNHPFFLSRSNSAGSICKASASFPIVERFAKGDSLEVEFEITQEFYQPANTYINKGYKIIKILKHIPRPDQGNLQF